jgi:DNA-binding NarL/FixJ family response regulator
MIRLAIIEDNAGYRSALEAFLKTDENIEVLYSGSSLLDIRPGSRGPAPDVVILDIALGKESGIALIPDIRKLWPRAGIFMLTIFEDEEKIINSIEAGATGFLLKNDPPDKILEAIRRVHLGEGVLNGQVARKMFNHLSEQHSRKGIDGYNLTKREKEIANLLVEGLSYKEIAARCFISISTLNSHILNIYNKLDVHSRAQITAKFR